MLLECKNLVKKYLNTTALENITLTLEPGRIYALLGPNGSGKSTFMKMAAGLVIPTSGEIFFEHEPIGINSKKHVAYMPTESYFYSYMTGRHISNYYKDFFEDFQPEKFERYLQMMNLDPKQKVSKMSSGMMAKLKIAVTLSRKSKLIMLDEPLNGIDIIAREQILNAISENFDGLTTFVISSHLVDELEQIVSDAIFIKHGHVELQGTLEDLESQRQMSITELYKEIYKYD